MYWEVRLKKKINKKKIVNEVKTFNNEDDAINYIKSKIKYSGKLIEVRDDRGKNTIGYIKNGRYVGWKENIKE